MKGQLYPLYITDHDEKLISLPQALAQAPEMTVIFGTLREEAKVKKGKKNGIFLSKPLQEALHIPDISLRLNVFVSGKECYLGPIVGVFTAGFKNFPRAPLGRRSFYFAKLLQAAETAGVLPIVFGSQHIHWEEGLISGYFYDRKNDEWSILTLPMPDVIYDRIPNRRVEQLEVIQTTKEKLIQEYAIPWFNPGFFQKWNVYQILSQDDRIRPYLPETVLFREERDLKRMLEKYDHVYVKWVHGSLGKGVCQIKRRKRWNAYFRDEKGHLHSLSTSRVRDLIRQFFPEFHQQQYMIQQGIPLIQHEGKPLDFRLHMNKKQDGTWTVTAMAAKISGMAPTTHLNTEGELKTVAELFPEAKKRKTIIKQLTKTALLVCETLEKKTRPFLGELGLDIGIDRDGHIWLFEANAKPGRSIFSHPRLQALERKNHIMLFRYAATLARLMIEDPETVMDRLGQKLLAPK